VSEAPSPAVDAIAAPSPAAHESRSALARSFGTGALGQPASQTTAREPTALERLAAIPGLRLPAGFDHGFDHVSAQNYRQRGAGQGDILLA